MKSKTKTNSRWCDVFVVDKLSTLPHGLSSIQVKDFGLMGVTEAIEGG